MPCLPSLFERCQPVFFVLPPPSISVPCRILLLCCCRRASKTGEGTSARLQDLSNGQIVGYYRGPTLYHTYCTIYDDMEEFHLLPTNHKLLVALLTVVLYYNSTKFTSIPHSLNKLWQIIGKVTSCWILTWSRRRRRCTSCSWGAAKRPAQSARPAQQRTPAAEVVVVVAAAAVARTRGPS